MNRRIPPLFRAAGLLLLVVAQNPSFADPPIDVKPDKVVHPTRDTSENTGPTSPNRVLPGERPLRKSYLIPAVEIPLFIIALNRVDVLIFGSDYKVGYQSIRNHIQHGPWVVDQDDFAVNQIGHPYQGGMYHGFARSANLNYWESFLYSNAGSLLWEITGETTNPSINDQVASGVAGSFIGEALYRLSNLVLENGGPHPATWRQVAAGFISPPTELNRLIFGERFGPVFEGRHPAITSRLQLGAASNATREAPGSTAQLARTGAYGDFTLLYGLPGKPGYRYQRPFDYFDFQINSLVEKGRQYNSGSIHGLLFGAPYEAGDAYRGVWGLYGGYDYLAPQVYRVSMTAASLGTTGQWWASKTTALQGTALIGMGYGAAGTILPDNNESDYHYGAAPQQLLAMRLLLGTRAVLEASGRNYYISGIGASKAHGTEQIQQVNTSFALRLFGHHALSIGYMLAHRNTRYNAGGLPNRNQLIETITLTYNLLGHPNFRAVEWRAGSTEEIK